MKYLIPYQLFEWDIPGDATGDPNLMMQNPRVPDTLSIPKTSKEWMTPPKRRKKKSKKKDI